MDKENSNSPPTARKNVVRLLGSMAVVGILMEIIGYSVDLKYAVALQTGGFIMTALGCIGYFLVQNSSRPK